MLAVGRRKEAAFLNGIESLTMPASGMLLAGFVFTRSVHRGARLSAAARRAVGPCPVHSPTLRASSDG